VGVTWLGGVVCFAIGLTASWVAAARLRGDAEPVYDPSVRLRIQTICEEAGFKSAPVCRLVTGSRGWVLVGTIRPVLLLPHTVIRDTGEQRLRLLLRHELAHLRGRDLWWNWLGASTAALFFFHPLAWYVLRELRMSQETACDEFAVGDTPDALGAYAGFLLECAVSPTHFQSLVTVGMSGTFLSLKRRIEQMKRFEKLSLRGTKLAAVAVACIAALGLLPWTLVSGSAAYAASAVDAATPRATAKAGKYTVAIVGATEVKRGTYRVVRNSQLLRRAGTTTIRRTANGEVGFGGGSGGGSYDPPNFALAVHVSPLHNPMTVTLDGKATAVDGGGETHDSIYLEGSPFRPSVPAFERAHPQSAGVYFYFDELPETLTSLKGTLLLTLTAVHVAEFSNDSLKTGAKRKTDYGPVTVVAYESGARGLQVEISTPIPKRLRNPGRLRSPDAFRQWADRRRELRHMVSVEIEDSQGEVHTPSGESGGGGGSFTGRVAGGAVSGVSRGRGAGRRSSARNQATFSLSGSSESSLSRNCYFAPLPEQRDLQVLRVRIVEPKGRPERVPFELQNIRLE
jgi:hypothetical protein